jgi:hypothetical protein
VTLKQDERALLQLICERGQSYQDLAGVLGVGVDEVRERARAALGKLGGADPDGEVSLTDYLLGQADPIGRADAVRFLQQDDEVRELAEEIAAKLRVIAPAAILPTIPEPRGRRREARAPAEPRAAAVEPAADAPFGGGPGAGDGTARRTKLMAAAASGGLVLLFAILAIVGVFGGGDDNAAGAGDTQRDQIAAQLGIDPDEVTDEQLEAAEAQRDITPVELNAEGGSGVAGAANFGLANDALFVDLNISGLDPEPPDNQVYVLWLMLTRGAGYPVSVIVPGENGTVQDRYSVPTAVAVSVGSRARFVRISQSPRRDLERQINEALESGAPVVPFAGELLSQGRIPLADPEPEEDAGDGGGGGADGG